MVPSAQNRAAHLLADTEGITGPVLCDEWLSDEGHWWSLLVKPSAVQLHDCLADGVL